MCVGKAALRVSPFRRIVNNLIQCPVLLSRTRLQEQNNREANRRITADHGRRSMSACPAIAKTLVSGALQSRLADNQ